jgi:hypothetical protein
MTFLLHLTYTSGGTETRTFPSAFARSLWMIALTHQPVTLRPEDRS